MQEVSRPLLAPARRAAGARCRHAAHSLVLPKNVQKVDVLRFSIFFFQAEDGIRDLVRSRGLGDVYKRQSKRWSTSTPAHRDRHRCCGLLLQEEEEQGQVCLLYTSDAADDLTRVDLGGRRIIKKKRI